MTLAVPQHVSLNGMKFIACREALVTRAYRDGGTDAAPKFSIGFGSQTPPPKEGDTITIEDAFARLRADIAAREPVVNRALQVPVSQSEFDALVSLYYQGGSDGLQDVAALFNAGEPVWAISQFLQWNMNAAGEPSDGLAKRRIREMIMALDGYYGDLSRVMFFDGNPHEVKPAWMPFPASLES